MVSSRTAATMSPKDVVAVPEGGIQNEIEGISYGKNKSEKKDIKPHKV